MHQTPRHSKRSRTRRSVVVTLLLPLLFAIPAADAGPTDDILPAITSVDVAKAEIGPGDDVAVLITGRFVVAPAGSDPEVSVPGDATVGFDLMAWDNDQIFGVIETDATTPRGLKTLQVSQTTGGVANNATEANVFRVGFTPLVNSVTPMSMVADNDRHHRRSSSRARP